MQELYNVDDVKHVKESHFFKHGNKFTCLHYNSVIFEAEWTDPTYKLIKLYCPSTTSSKMAKRCYEYVFHSVPDFKEWKALKEKFS